MSSHRTDRASRGIASMTLIVGFLTALSSTALADNAPAVSQDDAGAWLHGVDSHPFTQVFSLQAGVFHPAGLTISNSNSGFSYVGDSLNSYVVEPSWGIKLFHLLGAVYLEEGLAFSSFTASLPNSQDNLSLLMFGVDTRIKHSWEWFPVRSVIPFVEGGYRFTFLSQSGPSDFESADATVGNFVAGAGIDVWLNSILRGSQSGEPSYDSVPVFLTAKANRIFSTGGSEIDLGSTSFMAGLSIGI